MCWKQICLCRDTAKHCLHSKKTLIHSKCLSLQSSFLYFYHAYLSFSLQHYLFQHVRMFTINNKKYSVLYSYEPIQQVLICVRVLETGSVQLSFRQFLALTALGVNAEYIANDDCDIPSSETAQGLLFKAHLDEQALLRFNEEYLQNFLIQEELKVIGQTPAQHLTPNGHHTSLSDAQAQYLPPNP